MDTLDEVLQEKVGFYQSEVNNLDSTISQLQYRLEQAEWQLNYWTKQRKLFLEKKIEDRKIGFTISEKRS